MAGETITLKIDTLVEPSIKLKEEDKHFFHCLKSSIQLRGQIRTVLVCETEQGYYEVLDGTKIVRALKELGTGEVLCYNLGALSDEEKILTRLEVSRDYFLTNYVSAATLLKSLVDSGMTESEILHTVPYDKHKVTSLISLLDFDWNLFTVKTEASNLFGLFEE